MQEALIVLLDRGHFKTYNLSKTKKNSKRINLLKSYENESALQKLNEKISDQAGRFRTGNCENHNMKLEEEKRFIKNSAQDINNLIKKHNYVDWYFASSKSLNNKILCCLERDVVKCMKENITADLIKKSKMELLERFNF